MPTAPALETKVSGRGLEIKASADGWEISGFASTFSAPDAPKSSADHYGDLVMAGCFKSAVADPSRVKFCLAHGDVIGTTLELKETSHGLYGRWSIVDTVAGTDAHKLAKAGALDALSIGFFADEVTYREDRVRLVSAATLVEVSLVGTPANANAVVTSVKSASANGATMPPAAPAPVDMAALGARLGHLGVEVGSRSAHGSLGRRIATSHEIRAVAAKQLRSARIVTGVDLKALLAPPAAPGELYGTPRPGLALPGVTQFLPIVPTESGSVDVPRLGRASGALAVAQATAATGISGTKPELATSYAANVRVVLTTVAGFVEATTRALADAALLAQVVDQDVRQAVGDELDRQVLSGDGNSPNMLGILNTVGINAVTATAGSELAALLKAVALSTTVGRRVPTVAFVSLGSWAALVSTPAVIQALGPELRLPGDIAVVPTAGLADGLALVGCGPAAPIFARGGITVEIGFHGANFLRNVATVRGEVDAAVGVVTPSAWTKVSGLATAPA